MAASEQTSGKPVELQPRATLRVAVIGHTHVPDPSDPDVKLPFPPALATSLGDLLTQIQQAADAAVQTLNVYRSPTQGEHPCVVKVTSCLAPGADQIAAQQAVRLGMQLGVVIPEARSSYQTRMASIDPTAVATFQSLLPRAQTAVELHQISPAHDVDRVATRVLLDHADMVIAVWRGDDTSLKSGTTQGVLEARQRQLPILIVSPEAPSAWRADETTLKASPQNTPQELLKAIIDAIVGDPFDEANQQNARHEHGDSLNHMLSEVELYGTTREERQAGWLREQAMRRSEFLGRLQPDPPWFHTWDRLYANPARNAQREQEPKSSAVNPPLQHVPLRSERLQELYEHADPLASASMSKYRGTFVSCYLLGAAAVLMAVLGHVIVMSAPGEVGSLMGLIAAGIELGFIILIWRTFRRSRVERLHERAIDLRLLAETMRHAFAAAQVLQALPPARSPQHWVQRLRLGGWVHHYCRAILREVDFGISSPQVHQVTVSSLQSSCQWMLRHWLIDQLKYHGASWRRYHYIEHNTLRVAICAALLALAACGGHIVVEVAAKLAHAHLSGTPATLFSGAVLLICAVGPAIAAALHAISKQAETERLAASYERMEEALEDIEHRFSAAIKSPDFSKVGDLTQEAAATMLSEVEDWQTVYRFHGVMPG